MPELPEVETMVRGLRPALSGRTIRADRGPRPVLAAGLLAPRSWRGADAGRRSIEVVRRGKWVVIALAGRPGDYRHPAADDWRLLACRARIDPTTSA